MPVKNVITDDAYNALDMWEVLQSKTTSNLEIHQRKQMFKHTSIKDYCTYNTHI